MQLGMGVAHALLNSPDDFDGDSPLVNRINHLHDTAKGAFAELLDDLVASMVKLITCPEHVMVFPPLLCRLRIIRRPAAVLADAGALPLFGCVRHVALLRATPLAPSRHPALANRRTKGCKQCIRPSVGPFRAPGFGILLLHPTSGSGGVQMKIS